MPLKTQSAIVEQETSVGRIKQISAHGSIGFIRFTDGSEVQCETNATLRALQSAFGCVEAALGKQIEYATGSDGWESNLLAWFVPTEQEG